MRFAAKLGSNDSLQNSKCERRSVHDEHTATVGIVATFHACVEEGPGFGAATGGARRVRFQQIGFFAPDPAEGEDRNTAAP